MTYHFGVMQRQRSHAMSWSAGTVLALAVTGCWGNPVQRKLAGRWIGEGVENVRDDALAAATGWARGASLEFAGRFITVSIPAEQPRSAKYRVVRAEGRNVELEVLRQDGGTDPLDLVLDDEHRIRWVVGDGQAIVMRRER
jgi:hypothetical protein